MQNFLGSAEYLLLYDQHCPVCRRSVNFLMGQKGSARLNPLPLQTEGVLAKYNIEEDAAMREIHVVDRKGNVTVGADGVFRALGSLPRWRWVTLVQHVPPAMWASRHVYRFIASRRKRDQCEDGVCRR